MKHQQSTQSERDACPPQSSVGFSKNHPPQDSLDTHKRDSSDTWIWIPPEKKTSAMGSYRELTVEMKLDAVVVTVALAEEEQCLRALEKKVHMTALQMNNKPPHSSRRGMWSWKHTGIKGISSQQHMVHISPTGVQRGLDLVWGHWPVCFEILYWMN